MLKFIVGFNLLLFVVLTLCYSYQIVYTILAFFKKPRQYKADEQHCFAVLIAARNEEKVVGNLIDSIRQQNYPNDLVDIYVIADNCTDGTAAAARTAGAQVFERFNTQQVGKGYALDHGLKNIFASEQGDKYDGFFVLDADNLLDANFVAEMNNMFDKGYRVLTSYRNSKNYGTNWITAGHSLWFLRECKYLSGARMMLGTSCAISGTGFLVHRDILKKSNGWKHHLLTEDLEFSVDNVMEGEKIGYCQNAILYDEQPENMSQSWNQRLRWVKGGYQIMKKYTGRLFQIQGFKRKFACCDLILSIAPGMFFSIISLLVNLLGLIYGVSAIGGTLGVMGRAANMTLIHDTSWSLLFTVVGYYLVFFIYGSLTVITEWKRIPSSTGKKCLSAVTYPFFVMTYIPIAVAAIGRDIEWKPIHHNVSKTIEDFSI